MNITADYNKLRASLSGYLASVFRASRANPLNMPRALIGVARARASFDIGPRFHSLYDFRSKPMSEWGDYLLDRDFKKKLRAANGDQQAFTGDKVRFTVHCLENDLPTIPIIALIDTCPNPASAGFSRPSSAEQLEELLENGLPRMFIKLIDGTLGIDAFDLVRDGHLWRFCGQVGSVSELYTFMVQRLGDRRGWIVQPLIEPHGELKRIMAPNALGTIRAITFQADGGPRIAVPILRIPAGGNVADNFSHGLSGNLVAPIDLASGTLGCARFSRDRSWPDIVTADRHPDTGQEITGFVLPYWEDTKDPLIRAQAATPQMKTIGWDIAITDTGPMIVEANSTYDVDLLQVAYNRGLRREFETVLGEHRREGAVDRVV